MLNFAKMKINKLTYRPDKSVSQQNTHERSEYLAAKNVIAQRLRIFGKRFSFASFSFVATKENEEKCNSTTLLYNTVFECIKHMQRFNHFCFSSC